MNPELSASFTTPGTTPCSIHELVCSVLSQPALATGSDVVGGVLLNWFGWLESAETERFETAELPRLRAACETVSAFLAAPYVHMPLPARQAEELVLCAAALGDLRAYLGLPATDGLLAQPAPARPTACTLALLSLHNRFDLLERALESAPPELMSLWFDRLLHKSLPILSETAHANARRLLGDERLHTRYRLIHRNKRLSSAAVYTTVSYLAPESEAAIRRAVMREARNEARRRLPEGDGERHGRNPHTLAVISRFMSEGHAIHRCMAPLLARLKPAWRLICVWPGPPDLRGQMDVSLFDAVHICASLSAVAETCAREKAGIAFFPDVGLSVESLILANMRLAPVQCSGYGHPASTQCHEIDYYITSSPGETSASLRQYSEQPIPAGGLAAALSLPDAPQERAEPENAPLPDTVPVGLAWGGMKLNLPWLRHVLQLAQTHERRLCFHLIGLNPNMLSYNRMIRDFQALCDGTRADIVIHPFTHDKAAYYERLRHCRFGIDASPFGSFTTVLDFLACGRPFFALKGDKAASRLSAVLLEGLGLAELVACERDALLARVRRFMDDPAWRQTLETRLAALDLPDAIATLNARTDLESALRQMVAANTHAFSAGP